MSLPRQESDRARLRRFLVARGAGDKADELLTQLCERAAAGSGKPVTDHVSHLFRAAEMLMRHMRREVAGRTSTAPGEKPQGDVMAAREWLRKTEEILEALGPDVAQVFRRHRIDGVAQAAIAQELGTSPASVEEDLQKAYRALAELRARRSETDRPTGD